jgi:hypothetical protein
MCSIRDKLAAAVSAATRFARAHKDLQMKCREGRRNERYEMRDVESGKDE